MFLTVANYDFSRKTTDRGTSAKTASTAPDQCDGTSNTSVGSHDDLKTSSNPVNKADPGATSASKPTTSHFGPRLRKLPLSGAITKSSSESPSLITAPAGAVPVTLVQHGTTSAYLSFSDIYSKSSNKPDIDPRNKASAAANSITSKPSGLNSARSSLSDSRSPTSSKTDVRSDSYPDSAKSAMTKVFPRLRLGIGRSKTSPALLISDPIFEGAEGETIGGRPYAASNSSETEEHDAELVGMTDEDATLKLSDLQEPKKDQHDKKGKRVAIKLPHSQDPEEKDKHAAMKVKEAAYSASDEYKLKVKEDTYKASDEYKMELEREDRKKRADAVMARLDKILGPKKPEPCVYITYVYTCGHWKRALTEDQIKHSDDCPGGPGRFQRCGNQYINSTYKRFNLKCEDCEPSPAPIAKASDTVDDAASEHDSYLDSDEEGEWDVGLSMEDFNGTIE